MKKKAFGLLSTIFAASALLVGCGEPNEPEVAKYTITCKNEGEVFKTITVEEGKLGVMPSVAPTKEEQKESDNKYYSYTFSNWLFNGEPFDWTTPITQNIELNADYSKTKVTLKVTYNSLNVKYSEEIIDKGAKATKPSNDPVKQNDNDNYYSFLYWANGTTEWNFNDAVMEPLTLTAQFETTPRPVYKVEYLVDGETYSSENVKEEFTATKPTDPTKESTAQYDYTFDCWLDSNNQPYDFSSKVYGGVTLHAKFTEIVRSYEVTFMNGDTEVNKTTLEYGSSVSVPADPTKDSNNGYSYSFAYWSDSEGGQEVSNIPNVTGNATYYAVFTSNAITYKATIHHDYQGAPQDEYVEYTVENRETKIADVMAKLPSEDSLYLYSFKETIEELPLQNVTYTVNRIGKGVSEDFGSEELPSSLVYLNNEDDPATKVENGELVIDGSTGRSFVATKQKFQYFEMEFDVKFTKIEQTGGDSRIALHLGTDLVDYTENLSDNYLGDGSNSFGDDTLIFITGTVRFDREGKRDSYETNVSCSGCNFDSSKMHVKVVQDKAGLTTYINNVKVLNNVAASKELGNIIFVRANYGGIMYLDNLEIVATNGDINKNFSTDFSGTTMPDEVVHNGRSGETKTVADGVYTCGGLNNGNIHTAFTYSNFVATFEVKSPSYPRFVVQLGAPETNRGYANGYSDTTGLAALYFILQGSSGNSVFLLDNDASRNGKDGNGAKSYAINFEANMASGFVKIEISYSNGNFGLKVNDTSVITDFTFTKTLPEAPIILARAGNDPYNLMLDSFAVSEIK